MAFLKAIVLNGGTLTPNQRVWLEGMQTKVCLQVESEEELRSMHAKAVELGVVAHLIQDAGLTEFGGVPTLTACAIGPDEEEVVNSITGHLKLY